MSNLKLTNSLETSASNYSNFQRCCFNSHILKISLLVFGLLLIGSAVTAHFYQVNAIAVYTMGSIGGVLILATAIAGIVHCVQYTHSEAIKEKTRDEKRRQLECAINGDMESIEDALKNDRLAEPTRLLHTAASAGHAELVSLLLENSADPNPTPLYDDGYSALHRAVCCHNGQKSVETMRVLLAKDPTLVSVNAKQRKNLTPLHLAAGDHVDGNTHKQKVKLLIQNGANVNAKDSDGNTPLHAVAFGGFLGLNPNIEIIEILVRSGAQWNVKNNEGQSPFQIAQKHHAAWCSNPDIKKRLFSLTK